MKSGIAGLLLVVGMLAMGVSLKRHYFSTVEEVWTEAETEEYNQLQFNLHAATVPGAELEGSKEVRESRLKQLWDKQDKSTNSARMVTNVLWWGGLLSCVAGIGLAVGSKEKRFATLPAGAADAVAENEASSASSVSTAPKPKAPTKALGPESLGPENWR